MVDAPLQAVRDVLSEQAEVDGDRFKLPKIGPKTVFLSARIEGSLEADGTTSVVLWHVRHHVVEYGAVLFLGIFAIPGAILGIVGLWVAQSVALALLAFSLFYGLLLAVVLQLMKDERAKLRLDLETTLGRAGRWTVSDE